MSQKIPLYIPTFINSATYAPARVFPRLYYYNGQVDCETWYIADETNTARAQTSFPYFDHYNVVTGTFPTVDSDSLLFNNEAPVYGEMPTDSLYTNYWEKYITFLYNPKTRVLNCSAIIPLADYFEMSLNDIVNFRGNYYHLRAINDYNIKTGKCNLQLLGPIIPDALSGAPEPPPPVQASSSVSWSYTESSQDGTFTVYDNATTIATLTSNGSGNTQISQSHYVTASLSPVSFPSTGTVTMSLNVNGGTTLAVSSNANTTITASFLVGSAQNYNITGSIIYNAPPAPQRLAVSSSLFAYYDVAFTSSYSSQGQATIYDLSGNGNNGSVVGVMNYDTDTVLGKVLRLGSSANSNRVDMAGVDLNDAVTFVIAWYMTSGNYQFDSIELFVGRDPEAYGIFIGNGTQDSKTNLIINDGSSYPTLYTPVNSGASGSWHISQFSFNDVSNVWNYCMDGVTGSYTLAETISSGIIDARFNFNNGSLPNRYLNSGSMVQVMALYTGSLSTSELLQNHNSLIARYT